MIDFLAFVLAPVVVALFTAGVNFAVWARRREEHAHRWLALACLVQAGMTAGAGLLFASDSRAEALLARQIMMALSPPSMLTVLRFWSHQFYFPMERLERSAVLGTAVWCALGFIPGVFLADGSVVRDLGVGGGTFVDVRVTPLGAITSLLFIAVGVLVTLQARRLIPPTPDRRILLCVCGVAILALAHDMLVMGHWYDGPLLLPTTQIGVGVFFTALMMRRFVSSMERVEASADILQRAAEARAWELREKDLQLAHGARLAALGTLAAGLAHEINNPVAFIRSNLNYLDELARSPYEDAEMEEVLAETEEGVARIRGILQELVRMAAQGDARFGPVDLCEVVGSVLPTLRFEARADVRLEASLARAVEVWGDRNLLGQIVANLVMNAIQAVRGAGARGEVRIAAFAEGPQAVLEVSDTGPGISMELAQRVFEPFFTTKPAGEGTGLGLAVTRQLVERHGGRIHILASERGARLRVELPRASASRPEALSPRTSAPATTDRAAAGPARRAS